MFIFVLGREFRLSLAEIQSLFPEAVFEFTNEQIALVSHIPEEEVRSNFARMGGTIKIIKILEEVRDIPDFMTAAKTYLERVNRTNKVPFAIAGYGEQMDIFSTGLRIKKFLKTCEDKSFRLVNKDTKNINSAVYKKERLGESETEMNFVKTSKISYFGVTIAYQDVDDYAARDMEKIRDMGVGMLPPKLAQMMINFAGQVEKRDFRVQNSASSFSVAPATPHSGTHFSHESHRFWNLSSTDFWESPKKILSSFWEKQKSQGNSLLKGGWGDFSIYDPFCGLWTVLIEAANMGHTRLFGSDISPAMVSATKKSIGDFAVKKNLTAESIIFEADAAKISAHFPDTMDVRTTVIVTEWYLGEVLNARTITTDKIAEQRRALARIYDGFFRDLQKMGFRGTTVISFPFWELHGKQIFFEEIFPIIDRYGFVPQNFLDDSIPFRSTPRNSLLYKRPTQTVGREIFKLKNTVNNSY